MVISLAFVVKFLLVFSRLTSFIYAVPVFFPKGTPNIAKAGFGIVFSYMMMAFIPFSGVVEFNVNILIFQVLMEVITGLTLGFMTTLIFQIMRMSGQLSDFFVGFSMNQMFDPTVGENATIMGRMMYWFTLIMFIVLNGHKFLIEGILGTFDTVKLGELALTDDVLLYIIDVIINFFIAGVKIALPIAIVILIINLVMGLVSRSVPQLNVMILGMPVKILVGMISFIILLPMFTSSIVDIFGDLSVIFRNIFGAGFIPVMFFLADSGGEKTEDATPKKKRDAKKKGQVARSKELSMAITLMTATLLIFTMGKTVFTQMAALMNEVFSRMLNTTIDAGNVMDLIQQVLFKGMIMIIIFVGPIMIMGVVGSLLQVGFMYTLEPLKPDFKKLNPISGFKKILSIRSLVTMVKGLLIIFIVGYVGYDFMVKSYDDLLKITHLSLDKVPILLGDLLKSIFLKITLVMIAISLMDYIYQIYQHKKDLKMSKQEVKEEYKQMEGDPQLKAKIKQKQREMAQRRMMAAVPDASVVITNPTHIAVALRYKDGVDEAPILLAKGGDFLAVQIKEKAKEHEIPIIENKPLARMIFSQVEIEQEVPEDMYQAVAEILALVYKLKK